MDDRADSAVRARPDDKVGLVRLLQLDHVEGTVAAYQGDVQLIVQGELTAVVFPDIAAAEDPCLLLQLGVDVRSAVFRGSLNRGSRSSPTVQASIARATRTSHWCTSRPLASSIEGLAPGVRRFFGDVPVLGDVILNGPEAVWLKACLTAGGGLE